MAVDACRFGSGAPNLARRMPFGRIRFLSKEHSASFRGKVLWVPWPAMQKSSYRLDLRRIAFAGGDHGTPPIVPGSTTSSPLFKYVSEETEPMAMPPKGSPQKRLTSGEISLLKEWIEQGAQWPEEDSSAEQDPMDWWSFRPLEKPETSLGNQHPIDAFIRKELAAKGLALSPRADPRTLARRLYFDLIGLPPSPEALTEFERAYAQDAERAIDQLVETLLAMPQYGERWARHWLDVVHYGDTHGYDKDKLRLHAWPYRDYVIRAFNADKPYGRMVQEQIAGDVLWPDTVDGIEAMGFISAGPWDFIGHAELPETKTDGKIARHLDRDDMVAIRSVHSVV